MAGKNNTRNKHARYKKAKATMQESYPILFGNDKKPRILAIGVLQELIEDGGSGLSKTYLRDFLSIWCRRIEYLTALSEPEQVRVHLNGQIQAFVTFTQRKVATATLEHRKRFIKRKIMDQRKADKIKKALQIEDQTPDF